MKRLLLFLLLLFTTIVLLSVKLPNDRYILSTSYCNTPITYQIGTIDPRFQLNRDEVLGDVKEAAEIWNTFVGKPVFSYREDGKITVNFVYDERQELTSQADQLEKQLDQSKSSLDPQIESFKKRSAAFDQRVAAFNQKVDYWNSRGGAPESEFKALREEQQALEKEAQELNALARTLNQSTGNYNSQVGELNQTITDLKKSLAVKPEEGVFDGANNTISIYFNNTRDELIHTLAHELGHARGLDHIPDENAIMYQNSTEVTTLSDLDKQAMRDVCQERSYPEIMIQYYIEFLRSIKYKQQAS